jgi:dihydrofolate reductase
MTQVRFDMSMSLDGYIAGPHDSVEQGLGEGGERLHQWLYDLSSFRARHGQTGGESNTNARVLDEAFEGIGALAMGRRMFDLAEQAWGVNPPFHVPVFVLTHRAQPKQTRQGGTMFAFVTGGLESVMAQARAAAGEKDVSVAGGAQIIQQALKAGQVDEFQIHLIPILLGGGIRLFEHTGLANAELETTRVIESDGVTHLSYRVVKA